MTAFFIGVPAGNFWSPEFGKTLSHNSKALNFCIELRSKQWRDALPSVTITDLITINFKRNLKFKMNLDVDLRDLPLEHTDS